VQLAFVTTLILVGILHLDAQSFVNNFISEAEVSLRACEGILMYAWT